LLPIKKAEYEISFNSDFVKEGKKRYYCERILEKEK
jgi:hypothetical protein